MLSNRKINSLSLTGRSCKQRNNVLFGFLLFILLGCVASPVVDKLSSGKVRQDLKHGVKYYKVKKGDTLYNIAFRSGLTYRQLAAWNKIPPPYTIKVAQTIKLFKPGTGSVNKKQSKKKSVPAKKMRSASQKKSRNSKANKKVLKLYWQWPIKGRILKTYSQSGYKGIDIQGKKGQFVRSVATGKVVYRGNGLIGYGNLLIIKHNEQFLSAYAHNRRLLVKEGQKINKGQVIAEVGKNAENKFSLHFEIRKDGEPVNPIRYLPKK